MTTYDQFRLWLGQGFIAFYFFYAGYFKVFDCAWFLNKYKWAKDISRFYLILIGICEMLGAVGLVLPWATGIQPILTIWAAGGLLLMMLFAALFHWMRRENTEILVALLLGFIVGAIGYIRYCAINPAANIKFF